MKPSLRYRNKLITLYIGAFIFLLPLFSNAQIPPNDNCVASPGGLLTHLLISGTACTNTAGTVRNATNSGIAATCGGTADDDVWYYFISQSTDHTITLSSGGSGLVANGPRIELFSGTCGALTSIACGTTSIAMTNLARYTPYYIRVYSNGNTNLSAAAGAFNICVTHPAIPTPSIDFGKSYINISKPAGGTIEPGNILEIRASVAVRAGSFDSCSFTDNIPVGTTYVPGSLKILTNEAKVFRSFTDAKFDVANDAGWKSGSAIIMNLGYKDNANTLPAGAAGPVDNPATVFKKGRIRNNMGHRPSVFGTTCIMMATYRITVTVALNTTIDLGSGAVTYTDAPVAGTFNTFTFASNPVRVYENLGSCPNPSGTNTVGAESNGTFGSGNLRNRGTSLNVPPGYVYDVFRVGGPQDYYYGIANNTSTRENYTTSNTWAIPDPTAPNTHRIFTVWDIIGDHDGNNGTAAGNPAADTTGGKVGGYMLVVNAAYRIDSAFQHTITGLCDSTFYEVSWWMRNICSRCGCDSNGTGVSKIATPPYEPTGPLDSSGVKPALAIAINGIDYYTTGNINYTGQWIKKSFVFNTTNQTSVTLRFFNNAPGGGGNDWALDDIGLKICYPNMIYSPSAAPDICQGDFLKITDTVRSLYNSYVKYKWQRWASATGGPWTDISGATGTGTPVWNGTAYEYVAAYTIPPASTTPANNNDQYRLVVASTFANLSGASCSYSDPTVIKIKILIGCGPVLKADLLSVTGQLVNINKAKISWVTSKEDVPVYFIIEKSNDGSDFAQIAVKNGYNDLNSETNHYTFTDPTDVSDKAYYRVIMVNNQTSKKYSRVIQLSLNEHGFNFGTVVNPFTAELQYEITSSGSGIAKIELIDSYGKIVKIENQQVLAGANSLSMYNTSTLATGIYVLRASINGNIIIKRVEKK